MALFRGGKSSSPKTVLITGCSNGGIGAGLAKSFHEHGHHVFAAVRTPSKASDLEALPNVTILTLDVTSKDSIAKAVKTVEQHVGQHGLDVLVNNAGHGQPSPLIDVDLDQARAMYEVNVWGLLAMVQAFTPLLVTAKGTIVNVSSLGSKVNTPYIGLYGSSKAAVTMLSDTLRIEMAPLGIKVITAMTGMVRTRFFDNMEPVVLPQDSYYKPAEAQVNGTPGQKGSMDRNKMELEVYAERLVRDVLSGKTGPVYRGGLATTSKWLSMLMPFWILDWMLSRNTGLDTRLLAQKTGTTDQQNPLDAKKASSDEVSSSPHDQSIVGSDAT